MHTPLSIVIPTRDRAQILRRCLDAIEKQTIRDQLEVIVVIDGEDPKTSDMLANLVWSFPLTCFAIPKSQQGIARNRGVEQAKGDYVLFINDDVFLAPQACQMHLYTHQRSFDTAHHDTYAVLGFTQWDPSLEITPVMRWLDKTGWQFGYDKIQEYTHKEIPKDIQHRFTYTSHISLPKKIAWKTTFREDVDLYGWEDIEWGMRLRDAGISLMYEPDARALHHHHLTLEDSLKRMEHIGKSAAHFASVCPEFDRLPKGWKLWTYRLISVLPTMRGRHAKAFLQGMGRDATV
ncbi:hypothetical protein COU77_01195 [Candidatus Peregrinibacteria bacterium CG10_big_fil_rev_8_21_14_0_10_49_16]|nr:MAG: hypothetical protein COW95_03810 [Candidatus Peregrinibacteria bacterium CG22_combo_CG10-13_8_21_14_all_49_11]PIR52279.1 MAG: hypothetical protein COU77_01195 [Candidatus Peregrinibacteria bacterium CG10_big_fil_rev_8_21_14_0_10_49_16]